MPKLWTQDRKLCTQGRLLVAGDTEPDCVCGPTSICPSGGCCDQTGRSCSYCADADVNTLPDVIIRVTASLVGAVAIDGGFGTEPPQADIFGSAPQTVELWVYINGPIDFENVGANANIIKADATSLAAAGGELVWSVGTQQALRVSYQPCQFLSVEMFQHPSDLSGPYVKGEFVDIGGNQGWFLTRRIRGFFGYDITNDEITFNASAHLEWAVAQIDSRLYIDSANLSVFHEVNRPENLALDWVKKRQSLFGSAIGSVQIPDLNAVQEDLSGTINYPAPCAQNASIPSQGAQFSASGDPSAFGERVTATINIQDFRWEYIVPRIVECA